MEFIMQMRPLFGREESKAIADYMNEDGFITEFKNTELFEKMIGSFTGCKHCIAVNNGTIALTVAAMALGLKQGDEVIVPNYTMIATPNSLKLIGVQPVFVDVEPTTLCLDYAGVINAITDKTKAIILVSANGRYPETGIQKFEKLCRDRNLLLIEDAAQALGSYFPDGRHIGSAGAIGTFSFSAPKIISTGQGGALITNDDELAKKIRLLKDFGRSAGGNDNHDTIGFNFKFTELQAVIGIEQMKKLPSRINRKKEIFRLYQKGLSEIKQVSLFNNYCSTTAPWFYDILAEQRSDLIEYLKSNNIGTRVMYPPINKQNAYKLDGDHSVSNLVGRKGLWLPSQVQLKDSQVDFICQKISDFYR